MGIEGVSPFTRSRWRYDVSRWKASPPALIRMPFEWNERCESIIRMKILLDFSLDWIWPIS